MTTQTENKEKKGCIVKSNQDIKDLLFKKFTQAGLTFADVVQDARTKHGRTFTRPMLSRYLKEGQASCSLSQDDVIWLCDRYGIRVKLLVKSISDKQKSDLQRLKRKYV